MTSANLEYIVKRRICKQLACKDSHKVEGLYNVSGEFIPSSPPSVQSINTHGYEKLNSLRKNLGTGDSMRSSHLAWSAHKCLLSFDYVLGGMPGPGDTATHKIVGISI